MKPNSINILGKDYAITYCDNPANVDSYKRKALWGQVDSWTRTIRVYDNNSQDADVLHNILHEILHAIVTELNIKQLSSLDDYEDVVDILALSLMDVLLRNKWLKE